MSKLVKESLNEEVFDDVAKYKVKDTRTGEIIDDNMPKKLAEKLAAKKKEWAVSLDSKNAGLTRENFEATGGEGEAGKENRRVNEYSNSWVKTDKGSNSLLAYTDKVMNYLLKDMEEEEAWATMDVPFVQELLAQAAQKRKDPERFARRVKQIAQEEWQRNGDDKEIEESGLTGLKM